MNKRLALVLSFLLIFSTMSTFAFAEKTNGTEAFIKALSSEFGGVVSRLDQDQYRALTSRIKSDIDKENIIDAFVGKVTGTDLNSKLINMGINESDVKKMLSTAEQAVKDKDYTNIEIIDINDAMYNLICEKAGAEKAVDMINVVMDAVQADLDPMITTVESYMADGYSSKKSEFLVKVLAVINDNSTLVDNGNSPWTVKFESNFDSELKGVFSTYTTLDIDTADISVVKLRVEAANESMYGSLDAEGIESFEKHLKLMGIMVNKTTPPTPPTPTPDPDSDGSGGGSHSGGGTTTSPDKVSDKAKDMAKNMKNKSAVEATKAVTKFIDEDMSKMLSAKNLKGDEATKVVNEALDIVNSVLSKKDITAKQAKELTTKVINNVVKNLLKSDDISAKEAASIVEDVIDDVLAKAVANKDMTAKDAKTLVSYAIKNNLKAVIDKDKKGSQAKDIVEKLEKMANDIIAKAGKMEDSKVKVNKTEAKVDETALKSIIKNVADISKGLLSDMNKAGVKDANIPAVITVELDKKIEKVQLPVQAMKDASSNGVSVKVEFNEASFIMPPAFAELAKGNLEISVKKAEGTDEAAKGKGLKPVGMAFDFDVSTSKGTIQSFDKKIVITVPLNGSVNKDKLGVYIVDPTTTKLEFVKSKIVGNNIEFEAPHFSVYAMLEYNKVFADTIGHWAKNDIEFMAARQIAKGVDENNFAPENTITRAQFAALVVRTIGLDGVGSTRFADVATDAWYANEVALAADKGIVTGMGANTFAPNKNITREQMAVMVARAYKVMYNEDLSGSVLKFADKAEISTWAAKAIEGAVEKEIIKGTENNTFNPMDNAKRAHGIVMLKRLIEQ